MKSEKENILIIEKNSDGVLKLIELGMMIKTKNSLSSAQKKFYDNEINFFH